MLHRRSKGNYRQWLLVSCLVIFGSVLSAAFLPNMPVFADPCVASQPGCKCISLGTTQSCSWVEPTDTTTPGPVTPAGCDANHQSATCVCTVVPGGTVSAPQYKCIDPSTATPDSVPTATTAKDPVVCTGGALGWLLCSVAKVFKGINDAIAPQIEQQLKMDPLVTGSSISLGTRPIWGVMVGFANLVLVIAFLIVIFSQATSVGLSAYGIKKMLPRIIAAAVLINLSYFICGIAIDIANILGAAVQGIIQAGISALPKTTVAPASEFGMGLAGIATAVLGVGAVVIVGAVAYIVPLALMIILSTMVVFLGLAIRKIIIVLLIIVAPLAFAAMILPGTEGLFKKWQKSFTSMLVMYPVIMAILYGSLLVSQIILIADPETKSSTSVIGKADTSSYTAPVDASSTGIMSAIIAYAIIGLGPFAGTYMYIKNQNKIFSAAAGAVNKMGSPFKKLANDFASKNQARSIGSQLLRTSNSVADTAAQRKMINRFQGKGGKIWQGIATAGVGGFNKGDRAQAQRSFAAQIDEAHEKLRAAEVTATANNISPRVAEYLARGYHLNGNRLVGVNSKGVAEDLDINDRTKVDANTASGIDYLRKNGLIATKAGQPSNTNAMRAAVANLAKNGGLNSETLKAAVHNIDEGDRTAFVDYANNIADASNLGHLRYSTLGANKELRLGGRKAPAGAPESEGRLEVARSLTNAGVQKGSKYTFADTGYHEAFRQAHSELNTSNSTQYWSDLAQTSQDSLTGILNANFTDASGAPLAFIHAVGVDGGPARTMSRDDYLAEIAKAKPKINTP